MAPFSEYATHVKVAKEDEPTTVESAIFQSMTALGSSGLVLSEDGRSYVQDKSSNDSNNNPSQLIVEDLDASSNTSIVASRLKDHPPNAPMTPRQLLHLGCIWYLSADHYRINEELRIREEKAADSDTDTSTKHERKIDRSKVGSGTIQGRLWMEPKCMGPKVGLKWPQSQPMFATSFF